MVKSAGVTPRPGSLQPTQASQPERLSSRTLESTHSATHVLPVDLLRLQMPAHLTTFLHNTSFLPMEALRKIPRQIVLRTRTQLFLITLLMKASSPTSSIRSLDASHFSHHLSTILERTYQLSLFQSFKLRLNSKLQSASSHSTIQILF